MAKSLALRAEAKRLFAVDGLGVDEVWMMIGGEKKVSRKTLYNWMEEDEWEKERERVMMFHSDMKDGIRRFARTALNNALADPSPKNALTLMRAILMAQTDKAAFDFLEKASKESDEPVSAEAKVKELEDNILKLTGVRVRANISKI